MACGNAWLRCCRLGLRADTAIPVGDRWIRKSRVSCNPNWDFHIEPDTIDFFAVAIEVCDANMQYVNDHLDEAGGAFPPGSLWCPRDSRSGPRSDPEGEVHLRQGTSPGIRVAADQTWGGHPDTPPCNEAPTTVVG